MKLFFVKTNISELKLIVLFIKQVNLYMKKYSTLYGEAINHIYNNDSDPDVNIVLIKDYFVFFLRTVPEIYSIQNNINNIISGNIAFR